MKNKIIISVLFLLIAILGYSTYYFYNITKEPHYFTPIGVLHTNENKKLEDNINTYMEKHVTPQTVGKENYHCANYVYGYDDQYAYTDVRCQGYIKNDKGEYIPKTGFGYPIRFLFQNPIEYKESGYQPTHYDYTIIFADEVADKSTSDTQIEPTLEHLFPKELALKAMYNSWGSRNLNKEVENKTNK